MPWVVRLVPWQTKQAKKTLGYCPHPSTHWMIIIPYCIHFGSGSASLTEPQMICRGTGKRKTRLGPGGTKGGTGLMPGSEQKSGSQKQGMVTPLSSWVWANWLPCRNRDLRTWRKLSPPRNKWLQLWGGLDKLGSQQVLIWLRYGPVTAIDTHARARA